jgi:hypothetical protein
VKSRRIVTALPLAVLIIAAGYSLSPTANGVEPLASAPAPMVAAQPAAPAPPLQTAPLRALTPNVTYELVQYVCVVQNPVGDPNHNGNRPRLVNQPASGVAWPGPSPVLSDTAVPKRFRAQTVGWVFAEAPAADASQMQRWLLLNEFVMASSVDVEIKPASYMGGNVTAPTSLNDFTARARAIFDAAKLSSADPPRDKTRYVKVRNTVGTLVDTSGHCPPDTNLPTIPTYPTPAGNGSWDGTPTYQLDPGPVTLFLKSAAANPVVGEMKENNSGNAGDEFWVLKSGFTSPTGAQPMIVGTTQYRTGTEICEVGTGSGNNKTWNYVREASTYYSVTFPNDP